MLKTPEVRTSLLRLGVADIMTMSAPEFATFVAGEGQEVAADHQGDRIQGAVARRDSETHASKSAHLHCSSPRSSDCRLAAPRRRSNIPDRVIKLVVPFVPGSPVDVLARVVSQQMTTRLGQSVVIENRPGAGTSTATKQVQSSPADGYTLLMSGRTSSMSVCSIPTSASTR